MQPFIALVGKVLKVFESKWDSASISFSKDDYENTIAMLRRIIRADHDRDRSNPQRAFCGRGNLSIGSAIDYSNHDGLTKRDPGTLLDCISCA
jgi:hypothetical protein